MGILGSILNGFMKQMDRTAERMDRQMASMERRNDLTDAQLEAIAEKRAIIARATTSSGGRRTDDDFGSSMVDRDKSPSDFDYREDISLAYAASSAPSQTGVYVLYLYGSVMKCGRAAYSGGIHWRMRQYYNLNYDSRAQHGDHWAVNEDNRDDVVVSWQCCPESVCKELEYKLFRKYGKGPWGLRAPESCSTDDWELLI